MSKLKKLSILFVTLITYISNSLATEYYEYKDNKIKCRYFNGKPGSCRYGNNCNFTHIKETPQEYRRRHEIKEQQERNNLESEVRNLGISNDEIIENIKKTFFQEKLEKFKEKQKSEDLQWSPYNSMTKNEAVKSGGYSGRRNGSRSDPNIAKRLLDDLAERRIRGERISYQENLEGKHAYEFLNPSPCKYDYDY
jgi:hypothetical protein